MKKLICLLLFATSFNAYCLSPLWVGFGSTTRNYATAQNDTSGGTTSFAFNPTILVGATLPFFFNSLFISPGIGYAKFGAEDKSSRSEIILQYHLTQEISSFFLLHYGFSNTITKVSGEGGTVSLNNGSSMSTFYVPSESKSSFMASLDLAGELVFTSSVGARLQLSLDRFASSKRRRVSHLLTVNYYF